MASYFNIKNFLQNIVNIYPSAFQTFKPNTRLDIFFNEYMSKSMQDYNKIWPVMKIIFTLSHGKASIERGFSTNKKIEVENMTQESYVARRIVCDAINPLSGSVFFLKRFKKRAAAELLSVLKVSSSQQKIFPKVQQIKSLPPSPELWP
ncbi:hypothetical protein AVEN_9811-1 [Araneus ventricosus]|uniref:Uncharacterized protein n=1 Tax=Araneus ventricosus TaxID=182803 RepID=A0A4Y2ENU0_ARAVE|nr:hypothetical protein AVEN_9811-1 [Araneus ventricosus]